MSDNLSALFESANLGELSVGRSLRTGALAIIADGDTVICEFPGEHNFCTEHPEYAQLFVAALNAMPKLLDENYKLKHQVRDTCVRAENAEKSLRAQPAGGGEWLDCGHHESLMLKSAETGLPLYCALCDARTCASDNAIDAIEWKERALAAEADIERMTDAFNRENGPTFMGEPVLPPEKMVELEPGVKVPKWLLDDTRRVELYMKANLPGPWRIGGVQSRDYACATPPESGGQGDYAAMIARHQIRADECPGQSMVVLASSMRKLLATHPPAQASGAVTWEQVSRALEASKTGWHQNEFTQMRAAITAALTQGAGNER